MNPAPQFLVATGDFMYASTATAADAQAQLYAQASQHFSGPTFPVIGNHECTGYTNSNCATTTTANYTAYVNRLLKPLGKAQPYYTIPFQASDGTWTAKLVVVACNAWSSTQQSWLAGELAKATTFTLVARHEPSTATTAPCVSAVDSLLKQYPYDLLLVGHTHTFSHTGREVVVGIGGAPLTGSGNYGFATVEQQASGFVVTQYDYSTALPVKSFTIAFNCTASCGGKQCGSDGCGGSCGSCASGQSCSSNGQCVASCTASCTGKTCGSDGCGGSCGSCSGGASCSSSGQCVASSGKVVINEVSTRGTTTGDELIELFNGSASDVSLSGYKLYYRAASTTSGSGSALVTFGSAAKVPAGKHFLLATNGYTGSVTPDATFSSTLADAGGSVWLFKATPTSFGKTDASFVDLVGWGTAVSANFEGSSAAPAPGGANRSIERANGADTDNNGADFHVQATRTPQNTSQ